MLTGEQIKQARERAGWSQQELADKLRVSRRTVGNYEAERVATSRSAEARLLDLLAPFVGDGSDIDPLRSASDASLLAEIARRFDRARETERQEHHHDNPAPITRDRGSRSNEGGPSTPVKAKLIKGKYLDVPQRGAADRDRAEGDVE